MDSIIALIKEYYPILSTLFIAPIINKLIPYLFNRSEVNRKKLKH